MTEQPNRAASVPVSPTSVTPWNPDSQRLQATVHGLKLRITDQCSSIFDLGQTVYRAEGRLQLGCTLAKTMAPRPYHA
jgi:hypothetical protein